jgi:Ca2+-binding EF-hand superfamily protein
MLTKLKLALLISAPLVAGATSFAVAQGNDAPHQKMIEKFDLDHDGKLDDAERAQMKAAFEAKRTERKAEMLARFDLNKDGKLDDSERAALRDAKLADRFKAMDSNGAGKLSIDEFKAGAAKGGVHHARHGRHGHGRARGAGMKS